MPISSAFSQWRPVLSLAMDSTRQRFSRVVFPEVSNRQESSTIHQMSLRALIHIKCTIHSKSSHTKVKRFNVLIVACKYHHRMMEASAWQIHEMQQTWYHLVGHAIVLVSHLPALAMLTPPHWSLILIQDMFDEATARLEDIFIGLTCGDKTAKGDPSSQTAHWVAVEERRCPGDTFIRYSSRIGRQALMA